GRGQDGDLQLRRGVVQSRPSPFWYPLSIPNRLRDADARGNPNDLSDKPSTKPGQLHPVLKYLTVSSSHCPSPPSPRDHTDGLRRAVMGRTLMDLAEMQDLI